MAADSTGDKLALGSAIAGGAIATALIEILLDKRMLTEAAGGIGPTRLTPSLPFGSGFCCDAQRGIATAMW
jgi:hypothetical protein